MSLSQFSPSPTSTARKWDAITASASVLSPQPYALWVNQACTITIEGSNGNSETLTVAGAGPVDVAPTKLTAISTGTVIGFYL